MYKRQLHDMHQELGRMLEALKAKGKQFSLSRWRDWVRKADAGVAGHKLKSWVAPGDSDYLVAV